LFLWTSPVWFFEIEETSVEEEPPPPPPHSP